MSHPITNLPTVNTHMKDTEPGRTPHPSKALLEPGTLDDAKRIQGIELFGIGTWTDEIESTQLSSTRQEKGEDTMLLISDAGILGDNVSDGANGLSVPGLGKETIDENVALTYETGKADEPRQSIDTGSIEGFRYIGEIHLASSRKGDDSGGECHDADWMIV